MRIKLLAFLVCLSFISRLSIAQVPASLNYQGILKNSDGTLVSNNTYSLTFKIYETESGSSEIWSETQSITVTDGMFTVLLGTVNALNISFDKQYWLGISINGGQELTPRTKLTSVPYSFNTRSIPDSIVTSGKIAEFAVTTAKIDTTSADTGQALIFNGSAVT